MNFRLSAKLLVFTKLEKPQFPVPSHLKPQIWDLEIIFSNKYKDWKKFQGAEMKIYPGLCVMSQEGTWIIMVFGVESGFWESDSSAGFSVSWIRPYLIFALRGNSEQPYLGHFLPPHFHFPFRINQFDTKWQFQKIDTKQTIPITVLPTLNIILRKYILII